jgi:hypothetical protein
LMWCELAVVVLVDGHHRVAPHGGLSLS